MRKICFFATLLVIVALSSCKKDEDFDESLIPGKWQTGTEFWVYEVNGLGHTWDPAEDITEDEAQSFSWEVSGAQLTITHMGEMGETIPKTYTIKTLTNTTFAMKDEISGKVTTYTRVE